MTKSNIEEIANEVLNKYVSKGGAYKQFDNIFQSEKIKHREIDVDENKLCGVFTKAPNNQNYIMINKNINNEGRKNFTISHELGHYFLNHPLKSGNLIDKVINEECSSKEPMEYEADYFATCLLMPEEKLTRAIKSILFSIYNKVVNTPIVINSNNYKTWAIINAELTKRYGVSETALRYRLNSLNLVRFL